MTAVFADRLMVELGGVCGVWRARRAQVTWTASAIGDGDWGAAREVAERCAAGCGYPPGYTVLDQPGDRAVLWAAPGLPAVYLLSGEAAVVHVVSR